MTPHELTSKELELIRNSASILTTMFHSQAFSAGWWRNQITGEDPRDNPLCFSNKLALIHSALIHSEINEALEGDRKSKMDDHLPGRLAREVELADVIIRIFDLAGAYSMDLGGAIAEKLQYNAQRADHKLENRAAAGGKAY